MTFWATLCRTPYARVLQTRTSAEFASVGYPTAVCSELAPARLAAASDTGTWLRIQYWKFIDAQWSAIPLPTRYAVSLTRLYTFFVISSPEGLGY